jgi:hypothetical protein
VVSRSRLQALILTVLSFALGRCFVRSGVELVWLAEAAYSANRCPTLLKSDEATIAAAKAIAVNSAPFIGVGMDNRWRKDNQPREQGDFARPLHHSSPKFS